MIAGVSFFEIEVRRNDLSGYYSGNESIRQR